MRSFGRKQLLAPRTQRSRQAARARRLPARAAAKFTGSSRARSTSGRCAARSMCTSLATTTAAAVLLTDTTARRREPALLRGGAPRRRATPRGSRPSRSTTAADGRRRARARARARTPAAAADDVDDPTAGAAHGAARVRAAVEQYIFDMSSSNSTILSPAQARATPPPRSNRSSPTAAAAAAARARRSARRARRRSCAARPQRLELAGVVALSPGRRCGGAVRARVADVPEELRQWSHARVAGGHPPRHNANEAATVRTSGASTPSAAAAASIHELIAHDHDDDAPRRRSPALTHLDGALDDDDAAALGKRRPSRPRFDRPSPVSPRHAAGGPPVAALRGAQDRHVAQAQHGCATAARATPPPARAPRPRRGAAGVVSRREACARSVGQADFVARSLMNIEACATRRLSGADARASTSRSRLRGAARVDALVAVLTRLSQSSRSPGSNKAWTARRPRLRRARGVKLPEGPEPVAPDCCRARARAQTASNVPSACERGTSTVEPGRRLRVRLSRPWSAAVRAVDFGVLPPQPGSVGERWVETCAGRAAVRHERGNFSRKRKGGAAFALTWSKWNQPGEIRQLSRAPARNGLRCAPAPSKLVSSRAAGWAPVSGSPTRRRTRHRGKQPAAPEELGWPGPARARRCSRSRRAPVGRAERARTPCARPRAAPPRHSKKSASSAAARRPGRLRAPRKRARRRRARAGPVARARDRHARYRRARAGRGGGCGTRRGARRVRGRRRRGTGGGRRGFLWRRGRRDFLWRRGHAIGCFLLFLGNRAPRHRRGPPARRRRRSDRILRGPGRRRRPCARPQARTRAWSSRSRPCRLRSATTRPPRPRRRAKVREPCRVVRGAAPRARPGTAHEVQLTYYP